jgi:hypothetical protein
VYRQPLALEWLIEQGGNATLHLFVSFFIAIIVAMLSLDLIWWLVLARYAAHPLARVIIHLFMAVQ